MIKPDLSMPLPESIGESDSATVHFVGVGGSGMSGIAQLFLAAGHRVTGSDRSANAATEALRQAGALVHIGHAAEHLGDAEVLVYTGALWPDNPEYLAAVARGIPVLHRSQALAWLVRGHPLVAVAGAHGKTTSTSMIITALLAAGRSPSFVNGGVISGLGTSAAFGDDDLWVIEADESDGSFLLYDPTVSLITNIDADHLDHYGTHDAVDEAFVAFIARTSGEVVISGDDAGARRVTARSVGARARVRRFGEVTPTDVQLHSVTTTGPVGFALRVDGVDYPVQLQVPGHHNATNAAGAFAVLLALGLSPEEAVRGLEAFRGTERRFQLHDTVRGVQVIDDYAHHPTEVAAALEQARSVLPEGARLIAVHQPHLFSRTQQLAGEFAAVYERLADYTVVLDVFGAREDPIPGVTGALVADRFVDPSRRAFLPDWQAAADRVGELARDGDIVMTLSCGDVYRIIPQLIGALRGTEAGG